MKRFIVLFALAACSSSSATLITATEGGTVSTGTHDIVIPPASLLEDTEVVVRTTDISSVAPLADAHSEVLLLEPAGTLLETPAQVTIHNRFIDAVEGERIEIYQFDERPDGGWFTRESIATELGVQISVSRFSPIAVVVRGVPEGTGINGRLVWTSGDPASGAPLDLLRDGSVLTSTVTGSDGGFTFADLDPGTYTVTTEFECSLSETLTLAAGEIAEPTFVLCGPRPD